MILYLLTLVIIPDQLILKHPVIVNQPFHFESRYDTLLLPFCLLPLHYGSLFPIIVKQLDFALHVMKASLYPKRSQSILLPSLWEQILRPHVKLFTAHPQLPFRDHDQALRGLTLSEQEITQTITFDLEVVSQWKKQVHIDTLEDLYLRQERNALGKSVLETLVDHA
jgi:hypothetical protein